MSGTSLGGIHPRPRTEGQLVYPTFTMCQALSGLLRLAHKQNKVPTLGALTVFGVGQTGTRERYLNNFRVAKCFEDHKIGEVTRSDRRASGEVSLRR